ncbi:MAG: hypothetical protein LJF06_13785 [Gemmatimonadetes bacterium]|nr:hypothetical protein [Gemmatimonadota bacterium]
MREEEEIRRRLEAKSDEHLLDIVEGRDLGYRDVAVRIAGETLRRRGVPFDDVPLADLQQEMTQREEESRTLRRIREDRSAGRDILLLGIGAFVLPLFGLQFSILSPLGSATVLVAAGLIALGATLLHSADRAERAASEPQGTEEPRAVRPNREGSPRAWLATARKVLMVTAGIYLLIALFALLMRGAWR